MTVLNGLSKLFAAGYDLSGAIGALNRIGGGPALLDVSTLDLEGMQRISGRYDGEIGYTSLFETATAHPYLATLPTTDVPMMVSLPGLAAGDPAAMLVAKQANYDLAIGADLSAVFTVQALAAAGFPLEWGRLITAGKRTDTSATASGTGIQLPLPRGVAAVAVTSATAASPTEVTATAHGLATGESVVIAGSNKSALNVEWTVTVTGANTFTVPLDLTSGAATGGTVQRTSHRGWAAQNQTFVVTGTSVTVTVQDAHEAVSGSFANLSAGAFTAVNGAAIGAQRIEGATATAIIRRYVRVKTTGTFTVGTFASGVFTKEG